MYAIQFTTHEREAIAAVMSCCRSLATMHPHWQDNAPLSRLLFALAKGDRTAAFAAAQKFVSEAVPLEGDPHPQRAAVEVYGSARFTTFNRVTFEIMPNDHDRPEPDGWTVKVEFGRDSQRLACKMLMAFVQSCGVHNLVSIKETEGWIPLRSLACVLAQLLLRMDAEGDHSRGQRSDVAPA